uniref:Uncharacterized protein n=1 Tax=Porphyridium purpureum TaxID=35688 RepID=W0RYH2_PORPP|nr:hypothetical protein Y721_p109 [Porphyridium purpureum]ATJ02921.1 hypothetical protein [Porphyridium purpureum]BAO23699.1 hypothetical protein [Porphyridium purpureum]
MIRFCRSDLYNTIFIDTVCVSFKNIFILPLLIRIYFVIKLSNSLNVNKIFIENHNYCMQFFIKMN